MEKLQKYFALEKLLNVVAMVKLLKLFCNRDSGQNILQRRSKLNTFLAE
jgi:hypothetical protein